MWYLISYHSTKTHLVGGLRMSALNTYLNKNGVKALLLSQHQIETHEVAISEPYLCRKFQTFFNVITLPERSFFWSLKVLFFLKKNKARKIIISLPPEGLSWLGLFYKLIIPNCILVTDFRDPWTYNVLYHKQPWIHWWKFPFNKLLEINLLKKSNLVLFNTNFDLKTYTTHYPFLKRKSITIHNGFNLSHLSLDKTYRKKRTLVYMGGNYRNGEVPKFISKLLENLNKTGVSYNCDYYGIYHTVFEKSSFIHHKGKIHHQKVINCLKNYQYGLVYLEKPCEKSGRINQKFYDYIGTGVIPIVIHPSIELRQILIQLKIPSIPSSLSQEETIKNLKKLFKSNYQFSSVAIEQFSRKHQFDKLLNHLKIQGFV